MEITVANRLSAILFCLLTPGCLIIQTGVTNPISGLSMVAVVPFFNLSDQPDRVVDGRQFALAYFSELQKVPEFEVVPVGVTEIAMTENGLDLLNNRDHALELARILKVDAVVVDAVTDYEPYYPRESVFRSSGFLPKAGRSTRMFKPIPAASSSCSTVCESGSNIPASVDRGTGNGR